MMLYVNMAAKTTTYSSSHPCPMYMCKINIQGWERSPCCRCGQLYTMCILRELATAISVQVTSVRRRDWSNTVQNGFIAWWNCKDNRVIVNVYLQELWYILLVMNLWGITVKCTVYVGSLYFYGGRTSVTETVRLIVLLLYCYNICCFGDF